MHATNRRRMATSWLALLVVLMLVAAACGSSSKKASNEGDSEAAASDVDPNGILKIALGLQLPGGIHFDPTKVQGPTEIEWMQLVGGTLLRSTPTGSLEPMMVKSYKLVDGQTVQFTLRPGMKFTDGALFDAEAVKAGILRTRDQPVPDSKPSQDASIAQISDITIESPTELTVKFKTPVGGQFLSAMASQWGSIVSPKQAASAPNDIDLNAVGAGPYKIVSVVNNQSIKLTKNPDYWDADSWRIGGIEFHDIPDNSAQINGLRAGAVDLALRLQPASAAGLNGDPSIAVASAFAENSVFYINMCQGKPPFDNESVRQALNIGIDRNEINKLVYNGTAEPAYGLWPESQTAYYEPTLKSMLAYNPTKAKQLLASAGTPQVSFEVYYPGGTAPDYARMLEAIQAQVAKIGMTMRFTAVDLLPAFIAPQKPGAMMVPGSRVGVSKYVGVWGVGQRQALCGVAHPEIPDSLASASASIPGSAPLGKLFRDADLTIAKHAYLIPLVFVPRINAYVKSRVGGTPKFEAVNSFPMFDSMYIKKK